MHNRIGGISGVPGTVEHRIPGLAWHSGLSTKNCGNGGKDGNGGLDLPPPRKTPYAVGAPKKKKKKKKKKKRKRDSALH